MEYTVVEKQTIMELVSRVNQLISSNWKPCGGICVDGVRKVYQAMYKDAPASSSGGASVSYTKRNSRKKRT